jgi:hypothetical protein
VKQTQTPINLMNLVTSGWTKTNEGDMPFKKELINLEMAVYLRDDRYVFALLLPGGKLNLNPASMEELDIFERMVHSYETNQ